MDPAALDLIINVAAIVLSLTAILLTVIGFFASLRFYREGVGLHTQVRELLSRVEERVASVQTQVGGMFAKTLDAAIGRSSPQAAAEDQRRLMKVSEERTAPAPEATQAPAPAQQPTAAENLASKVMDYFAFKKLRYTDVSTGDARAVFNLGADHGFNLFDGLPGIVFFGYLHELSARQILARVRFLLNNLEAAYKRIETAARDQRDAARAVLDQIRIEVLIPEDADKDQLLAAIDRFQPSSRRIDVTLIKPSEVSAAVEAEYERLGF